MKKAEFLPLLQDAESGNSLVQISHTHSKFMTVFEPIGELRWQSNSWSKIKGDMAHAGRGETGQPA